MNSTRLGICAIGMFLAMACGQNKSDKEDFDKNEIYNKTPREGDDVGAPTDKPGLPSCDAKRQDEIRYLATEKSYFVCRDGKWESLGPIGTQPE